MPRQLRPFCQLILLLVILFQGCAGLGTGYEAPSVSVSSFRALPGEGVVPRFEIGLHIVNPNREPLDLVGVAYTITVEGHRILTGAANDLPRIAAYGEGDIRLQAGVDLISSILFFRDLARGGDQDQFTYTLEAKLDVGAFTPVIRVSQKGDFNLNQGR